MAVIYKDRVLGNTHPLNMVDVPDDFIASVGEVTRPPLFEVVNVGDVHRVGHNRHSPPPAGPTERRSAGGQERRSRRRVAGATLAGCFRGRGCG